MADKNRYSPPKSVVADPQLSSVLESRPKQVRAAVAMLWISLALGIPEWILSAARDPEHSLGTVVIVFMGLFFVFCGYLIVMVNRGRNWARIVTLVFVLLALLFTLMPIDGSTPPSEMENALNIFDLLLQFTVVFLLFTKPGSLWFKLRE